jgi:hypothetical protein
MRSVILILCALPLFALDRVELRNGDKLSGEVVKIEKDKLSFKTEYAGVIQIEWKQVAKLDSEQPLQVEADNGWRFVGAMTREGDKVAVQSENHTETLEAYRLVKVSPVQDDKEPDFWENWNGGLDFGYNFARGNTDLNQSSVTANANFRTNHYKFQADVLSLFSRQNSAANADRHLGTFRLDRFLGPETFVYSLAVLEHDARRRLNFRTNLGGGLGWKLVKSADQEISLLGGVTMVTERFNASATNEPFQRTGEGLLGFDLRQKLDRGVTLSTRMSITPNIIDVGRYRIAFESGARLPLVSRYVWSVNIFNRFDSRPPVQAERNDYGAISSLGITF